MMNRLPGTIEAGIVCRARPGLVVATLAWRECLRFLRQRNRLVGALGQPLLFWWLLGAGLDQMFQVRQLSFREYYFPGTLVLILLFTAIFATISIIEDRREGFLQAVLVAPVPRWAMVCGKILGGALIASLQGLLFLGLALTLGIRLSWATSLLIAGWLLISALALTALGFALAWRMQSTQGFHAVMNLLLMPLWLLSGAFFPVPVLAAGVGISQVIVHWVMRLNPVTYVVAGLRRLIYLEMPEQWADLQQQIQVPPFSSCLLVVVCFGVAMFAWAWRLAGRTTVGDLL